MDWDAKVREKKDLCYAFDWPLALRLHSWNTPGQNEVGVAGAWLDVYLL